MIASADRGQIRQLVGANMAESVGIYTYREMLHEVEQNVDVVVGTMRWIFLKKLAHAISHDQRLIHKHHHTHQRRI